MRSKTWGLVCLIILCISGTFLSSGFGEQSESSGFVDSLHRELDDPGRQYAIEARWWLAEGTHSDQTLIDGIQALYDAGYLGGTLRLRHDRRSEDCHVHGCDT